MNRLFLTLAVIACPLISQAAVIETTFTGVVTYSLDASNILGYGGSSATLGRRITYRFRWDTATAPGDYYGGARFPVEADYTNYVMPVWIRPVVTFDNGKTFSDEGFDGSAGVQQQVKIQDDCARCSYDPIGGAVWDSYGNFLQIGNEPDDASFVDTFIAGARVFDYSHDLVSSLDIGQLVNWSPGAPGTFYADGQFAWRHVDRKDSANDFFVEIGVRIDSLTSRAVPEPATLALAALGLTALAFTRRRRQ